MWTIFCIFFENGPYEKTIFNISRVNIYKPKFILLFEREETVKGLLIDRRRPPFKNARDISFLDLRISLHHKNSLRERKIGRNSFSQILKGEFNYFDWFLFFSPSPKWSRKWIRRRFVCGFCEIKSRLGKIELGRNVFLSNFSDFVI